MIANYANAISTWPDPSSAPNEAAIMPDFIVFISVKKMNKFKYQQHLRNLNKAPALI
jgi:hypothetical protein